MADTNVANTAAALDGDTLLTAEDNATVSGVLTFSTAPIFQDSVAVAFGTGSDATIQYDGTDMLIKPAVVGSGDLVVSGGSIEFDDSEGVTLGTGKDATLQYDGTDVVLSPAAVGSGDFVVSGGSIEFDDSEGVTLGTGKDATIQYDGTDLVVNPRAVGSGNLSVSSGGIEIKSDSQSLILGAGEDATIQYDGTNLLVDPQAVGSGLMRVSNGNLDIASGALQIGASTVIDSSENADFGGTLTVGGNTAFNAVDNQANAFQVIQASNNYINVVTTNAAEKVTLGNTGTDPDIHFETNGDVIMEATSKFFPDGGGDTAIWEVSANTIRNQAGGSGGVDLTSGATSWSAVSDERLKTVVEPITSATEKLSGVRTVIGRYNDDSEDRRRSFLIAQDFEDALPEAVTRTEDSYLRLAYTDTIPLVIAGVNEHTEQIRDLMERVAMLEGGN